MKDIVFATHNANKVTEIAELMKHHYRVLSLTDINCNEEIAETGSTFAENAYIKANYVFEKYQLPCFADDSGLAIDALHGEPGIYSARYASTGNDADNISLVLQKMQEHTVDSAHFTTVIALVGFESSPQYFEGIIHGTIIQKPIGENGFGYDPIFMPNGYTETFAQMTKELKNKISHRGIAVQQLIQYLNS